MGVVSSKIMINKIHCSLNMEVVIFPFLNGGAMVYMYIVLQLIRLARVCSYFSDFNIETNFCLLSY